MPGGARSMKGEKQMIYKNITFKAEDVYKRQSWGSARETFSLDDMKEVRMPLPSIDVQKSIVGIYEAYTIRKEINEKLKAQIKDICPILIKGSIEEATKAKEA